MLAGMGVSRRSLHRIVWPKQQRRLLPCAQRQLKPRLAAAGTPGQQSRCAGWSGVLNLVGHIPAATAATLRSLTHSVPTMAVQAGARTQTGAAAGEASSGSDVERGGKPMGQVRCVVCWPTSAGTHQVLLFYGSSLSSSLAVQAAQPRRRLRQQVVEDDESDTEAEVDASACITATAAAAAAEQHAPLGAQLGKRVRKPPKQFADHMLYDEGNAAAATADGR